MDMKVIEREYRTIKYTICSNDEKVYVVMPDEIRRWCCELMMPTTLLRPHYEAWLYPEMTIRDLEDLAIASVEQDIDDIISKKYDRMPSVQIKRWAD